MDTWEIMDIHGDIVICFNDKTHRYLNIYSDGISFDNANGPLKKHDLIELDPDLCSCMRQRFIRVGDFN